MSRPLTQQEKLNCAFVTSIVNNDDLERVRALITQGADLNKYYGRLDSTTPLLYSIDRHNGGLFRVL